MEIIASSLQKAGDFFLHAGYLSAANNLANDSDGVFPKFFATFCLAAGLFLINELFEKPKTRAVLDLTLIVFVACVMMGCGPPR